jgi:hypothetical protein
LVSECTFHVADNVVGIYLHRRRLSGLTGDGRLGQAL